MSRQLTNHWQNELSIRYENTRFAFMFILFSLFAFLLTILLFIFANNSYKYHSELFQRNSIPYFILAFISLSLFIIFFIGSLVYTTKSLLSTKPPPIPLPRTLFNSPPSNSLLSSGQTDV